MTLSIAAARAQIAAQIVDGPDNSITPSKLRQCLLDAVDSLQALGLTAYQFQGAWNAGLGSFPGGGGALRGYVWQVSGPGTVDGREFKDGDELLAIVNNASATSFDDNWLWINSDVSADEIAAALAYTPVDPADLGTAAALDAGTGAGDLVQLDGTGKLPAVDGSQLIWQSAKTGSIPRTVGEKLGDVVDVRDFGTGAAAVTAALGAGTHAQVIGSVAIATTLTMSDYMGLRGGGARTTALTYSGSGVAISSPDAGSPSYAHTFYHYLSDMELKAGTHHTGTGLRWVLTGWNNVDRVEFSDLATGIELRGAVGSRITGGAAVGCLVGVLAGGFADIEAATQISFNSFVFEGCGTAIKLQGPAGVSQCKGLRFNDCVFESCVKVLDANGTRGLNFVWRGSWFEDNNTGGAKGTIECTGLISPVFDATYHAAAAIFTGGWNLIARDIHITGTSEIVAVDTDQDTAHVSITTDRWTDTGIHGANLTMPPIGSASTPNDLYSASECAQSMLIGELAGTLFGYAQPATNIIGKPVSQTAYDAAGWWPYGGATVATGQADMYGGTKAVKLSGAANHGCYTLPTTAGAWYTVQMAFNAVAAGERVGLFVESVTGGALGKMITFKVPDTKLRAMHLRFKAPDNAGVRVYVVIPPSGVVVQPGIGMYAGTEFKPFLPEGASIPLPFIMRFGSVESHASAAPVSGTWRVGDKIYNKAPAAGGSVGWVCTTAGTPGTWKTFGAIAA